MAAEAALAHHGDGPRAWRVRKTGSELVILDRQWAAAVER